MIRPAALIAALAIATTLRAEVTPGEILIAEMNCSACHDSGPLKERLASRQSPRLGTDGVRATPQWLRAFLADPQKTKPGTLMPDLLHGLPPEQRDDAAEALTHFLVSVQPATSGPGRGASATTIAEGERLYHTLGCVMCHAPMKPAPGKENDSDAAEQLTQLAKGSVPMAAGLAEKYTLAELARFLRDPLKARPSGRMPGMNLSESEADAIAMYLLRDQAAGKASVAAKGLQYDYYENEFPELPEFDRLTPTVSDVTKTPTLKVARRKGNFALRFRGNLVVPKAGKYTFFTESDDGSRLSIDGRQVVENGGIHPRQERSGEMELTAGTHAVLLTYFDGGGEAQLKVSWKTPDGKKEVIPADTFTHDTQPMRPLGDGTFVVDAGKAARGKELFAQMNCAACHAGAAPDIVPRASKPLTRLVARQPRGCLSTNPKPEVPKFDINDRQRQVMLSLLQQQDPLNLPLEPEQQIRRTLTTMNCYACHVRDRRGGAEAGRREYFSSVGEVDLGEEGRVPPTLTGVGAKLRPEWVKQVLEEGAKVRPYMATRMPQFGLTNVAHLPALFETADSRPDALPQPDVFAPGVASDANKFGRKLIGVGGLTCIACHTFAGNPSLGVPAIDLASSAQRLKWDWFRRYLLDPQSLRPGTRMPAFWPGAVAANKEILGGDAEKQIFAIWGYLARKNYTDLPPGLVQGKMELIPTTEPIIYRNFIEGGGPRAIGVGYPERANLCFDANDMRLALLWQGAFIDAARHRSGRGQGFEKPLGGSVVKGPPGAPFALLAGRDQEWPAKAGKEAGYQFRGYKLDQKRRPVFQYSFDGIDVEDYPTVVPGDVEAEVRRTLSLKAKQPTAGKLYFRAAVGSKIEPQQNGSFLVDERVSFTFSGATPVVRNSGGAAELLVPVTFKAGTATLVEQISW